MLYTVATTFGHRILECRKRGQGFGRHNSGSASSAGWQQKFGHGLVTTEETLGCDSESTATLNPKAKTDEGSSVRLKQSVSNNPALGSCPGR